MEVLLEELLEFRKENIFGLIDFRPLVDEVQVALMIESVKLCLFVDLKKSRGVVLKEGN